MASLWTADSGEQPLVLRVKGCLDKLSASLLQAARMRSHHDALVNDAKANARSGAAAIALNGLTALADFEGLLLHSRAALDRLAWFLSARFRNPTQSFRRLGNVLQDFRDQRPEAAALLAIMEEVGPSFDALLAAVQEEESLRDLVGHKHSLSEGIETCFSVAYVPVNRVILFDCEVALLNGRPPIPLLEAAHALVGQLTFTVLSSLGVVLGLPLVQRSVCQATWELRTSVRTRYIVDEAAVSSLGPNALLTVRRMTPAGYDTAQWNYRAELWERAVDLAAV